MKTNFSAFCVVCIITLGGNFHLQAAPKQEAAASPSPAGSVSAAIASRPIPFSAKIYSVDKIAKTFSTQSAKEKKLRVFAILPESKITKENNKPATFEDLKPDWEVRGFVLKKGEGHFDVLSLQIGQKEDPTKGAPKASAAPSAIPTGKKKSK